MQNSFVRIELLSCLFKQSSSSCSFFVAQTDRKSSSRRLKLAATRSLLCSRCCTRMLASICLLSLICRCRASSYCCPRCFVASKVSWTAFEPCGVNNEDSISWICLRIASCCIADCLEDLLDWISRLENVRKARLTGVMQVLIPKFAAIKMRRCLLILVYDCFVSKIVALSE